MTSDRERLATQQGQLLRALLAGGAAPPGFDERHLDTAAITLRHKRGRIVGRLRPDLYDQMGDRFAELFDRYAAEHPKDQNTRARQDADRFGSWLAEHKELPKRRIWDRLRPTRR